MTINPPLPDEDQTARLDALWRPQPAFVGPVMPPMLLWLARGRPKDDWQIRAEQRRACPGIDELPLFAATFHPARASEAA